MVHSFWLTFHKLKRQNDEDYDLHIVKITCFVNETRWWLGGGM